MLCKREVAEREGEVVGGSVKSESISVSMPVLIEMYGSVEITIELITSEEGERVTDEINGVVAGGDTNDELILPRLVCDAV